MAIVLTFRSATKPRISKDEQIAKHFSGSKGSWRKSYDELLTKVHEFRPDISTPPTNTYISLLCKNKKFGIFQVTSERPDIGIKLKDAKITRCLEATGTLNSITHRVRIDDPNQIDAGIISWQQQAYEKA